MPVPPSGGGTLALFLMVGVGLSLAIEFALDESRAYWIALIFVGRGLVNRLFPETAEYNRRST